MRLQLLLCMALVALYPTYPVDAGNKPTPKHIPKAAPKKASPFSAAPFDLGVIKLPEGYSGNSVLDIYQKLPLPKAKGEFEKSDEYETRLANWKATPFFGRITPSDLLAFELSETISPNAFSLQYNADDEKLTANISFQSEYFELDKVRWLEVFRLSKNLGSHMGITRMGIKFRYSSHVATSIGLGIKEPLAPITISRQLPREEAKEKKPHIRAYVIIALAEPFKINNPSSTTASLDNPSEWHTTQIGIYGELKSVWLVNSKTGEILAKSDAPFEHCQYDICI